MADQSAVSRRYWRRTRYLESHFKRMVPSSKSATVEKRGLRALDAPAHVGRTFRLSFIHRTVSIGATGKVPVKGATTVAPATPDSEERALPTVPNSGPRERASQGARVNAAPSRRFDPASGIVDPG